ncbi:MAG: pyridoxal-phosphate dependent enzyme, partial [Desulfobacterales bacterium]
MPHANLYPDFSHIEAARERLAGQAHRTPVVTSRTLDSRLGGAVFFKCENLQRMGAFKFRGAFNAMSQLTAEERRRGVLTFSSGNHAQAVALVGRLLDIPTTVVMPGNAPEVKRRATAGYGATIIPYDPQRDNREDLAAQLQEEKGLVLIPPFDHPHIIAGQGTAALELMEEVPEIDTLLVPCGGGGLLSGCAIAAKQRNPRCRVIGVEPEAADDGVRSFHSGTLQRVDHPDTIADGTRTPCLGRLTFPLIRRYVDAMKSVSEGAIAEAVRFLFYRLKLVV